VHLFFFCRNDIIVSQPDFQHTAMQNGNELNANCTRRYSALASAKYQAYDTSYSLSSSEDQNFPG
jgi:hypothetical protein